MTVNIGWIQAAELRAPPIVSRLSLLLSNKKAGTRRWSRQVLAGCPDKIEALSKRERAALSGEWELAAKILSEAKDLTPDRTPSAIPSRNLKRENLRPQPYAVLLGRTVKSRTWVKMLDICIPFSCETNGSNSAMN